MAREDKEYIVIKKSTVENAFFIILLSIFLIFLIVVLLKGFLNVDIIGYLTGNPDTFDINNVAYYEDGYLNIRYPIPANDWGMAPIEDFSYTIETVEKSMGDDGVFSLQDDMLCGEVLSTVHFNDFGEVGYRQFMSFTFKGSPEYSGITFVEYCRQSFITDIQNVEDYESMEVIDIYVDDFGGVMQKLKVHVGETVNEETGEVYEPQDIYYTQYMRDYGKNIGTCTFGSATVDEEMEQYIIFFMNNVVVDTSLAEQQGIELTPYIEIIDKSDEETEDIDDTDSSDDSEDTENSDEETDDTDNSNDSEDTESSENTDSSENTESLESSENEDILDNTDVDDSELQDETDTSVEQ